MDSIAKVCIALVNIAALSLVSQLIEIGDTEANLIAALLLTVVTVIDVNFFLGMKSAKNSNHNNRNNF